MSELAIELRLIGREIFHERYIDAGVVPLTLARAADRIEALEAALREARQYVSDAGGDEDSETQRHAASLLIVIDAALAPEQNR